MWIHVFNTPKLKTKFSRGNIENKRYCIFGHPSKLVESFTKVGNNRDLNIEEMKTTSTERLQNAKFNSALGSHSSTDKTSISG